MKKTKKILFSTICISILPISALPLASCSCKNKKEITEWGYDWKDGVAYTNNITRSNIEFVDIEKENGFNNAYLSEVANNKQILASDIFESLNNIWLKQSGNVSQKTNDVAATVKNVYVNNNKNDDYTLSFDFIAKANISGWNTNPSVNKLISIKQTVELSFTNVKLIADHNFHFQINLDNTSNNWSIKGEMTQQLGEAEETKLDVNLSAGKTQEIAAFKSYAYNSDYETFIFDSLVAYNLENASTIDRHLTEKEPIANHDLTFSKLYNKTKEVKGKIKLADATEAYWPKVEIFCEYDDSGTIKTQTIGSWTTYDVIKGDQEFKIIIDDYTNLESYETKHFYIKLTLQEYKELEFDINSEIKSEILIPDDCPKHAIVNNSDGGWSIPLLKFKNTNESKTADLWQYSFGIFDGEADICNWYIEKYPNYQEMIVTSLYGSDKILSEKITVKIAEPNKMESIPVGKSALNLPDNIYLSLDDVDYFPVPPYMLVLENDYYWMWEFYACINGKFSNVIKRIKFTLSQKEKSWSLYAFLNGESSFSTPINFYLSKDDGVDPNQPVDMTAEVQDPYFAEINQGSTPDSHWWWNDFEPERFIYKDDNDGKLHFKAKLKNDGSITTDKKIKIYIADERSVYAEQHIIVPAGQTIYDFEWVQDWDINLNNKKVKLFAEFEE